jgi:DNA-binding MurR/RpiR family transcriptional regulator
LAIATAIDSGTELDRLLRRANQQLGAAGLRVAKFIDENRQVVLASSAAALGARIGTSDATVLRKPWASPVSPRSSARF